MIRYDLKCARGCRFDAWFRDSAGFEAERDGGRLTCPHCGAGGVDRALMAPAVSSGRAERAKAERGAAPAQEAARPALSAPPEHPLHQALAALRGRLEREADYVGPRFADEARRMHEGEIEARAIWGEATLAEAEALLEDGAPVAPLPPLPRRDD